MKELQGKKVYAVVDNDLYSGTNSMTVFVNRTDAEKKQQKEFQDLKDQYKEYIDHRGSGDFASKDFMIELGDNLQNEVCDRYLEIQELAVR